MSYFTGRQFGHDLSPVLIEAPIDKYNMLSNERRGVWGFFFFEKTYFIKSDSFLISGTLIMKTKFDVDVTENYFNTILRRYAESVHELCEVPFYFHLSNKL